MKLPIRYRGLRYLDRTVGLETGEVAAPGIDLQYEAALSVGGIFEAVTEGNIDAAEVLLGRFVAALAEGDDRLVGLPVFPARRFAQRFLFVHKDSPLTQLSELDGKRIGWPSGGAVAAAWVRDLVTRADVDASFVEGRMGGALTKILDLSETGDRLPGQLLDGSIDALVTPYPVPANDGGGDLRLLLAEPSEHERSQVRAGGSIPIVNVVVVRRELYERERWLVWNLVDAFAEAQSLGRERMNYFGALAIGLPTLQQLMEEIDDLFGGEAFPYGVPQNRTLLEAFAEHAAALGFAGRVVAVDEMFPPEVLAHPGVPDDTAYGVPMRGTP